MQTLWLTADLAFPEGQMSGLCGRAEHARKPRESSSGSCRPSGVVRLRRKRALIWMTVALSLGWRSKIWVWGEEGGGEGGG